ncbi:hypothetical protein CA457_14505 [Salmonella enterica]|nr:hypothetical protein [Salmonella enterica]
MLQTGISLPPAASVPRPDGHGTGGFSAPVRRRCDFTRKRLARTVLIFTEWSEQPSRATDRAPGLPASPGYAQ